ncbi:MAG TPA: SPOR domain-containing protein [Trueperaceae bacterium]|nr:SPOR domain-containing protein [Trueperaceae bacterium]
MTSRPSRALWCVLAAVIGGLASAQPAPGWSVQVVALRDFREAQAAVTELSVLEFDAYTEFSMADGQQYVRVRTGCFTTRDAAEALANVMRGRVTAEAEAVELTPGAPVRGCVDEEVGFLNSYDWELMSRSTGVPSFRVAIASVVARVVHDGRRWIVLQGDGEPQAESARDGATARIVQRRVGGTPFAALDSLPGPVLLCPGTLVATVADVAIVERTDVIVACRLMTPGTWEASR